MDEKEIYNDLYRKILNVQNNMVNAISSLDSFKRRIDDSLVIDDKALFKDNVEDVTNEIDIKQNKIKNEIIPEIQSKLL